MNENWAFDIALKWQDRIVADGFAAHWNNLMPELIEAFQRSNEEIPWTKIGRCRDRIDYHTPNWHRKFDEELAIVLANNALIEVCGMNEVLCISEGWNRDKDTGRRTNEILKISLFAPDCKRLLIYEIRQGKRVRYLKQVVDSKDGHEFLNSVLNPFVSLSAFLDSYDIPPHERSRIEASAKQAYTNLLRAVRD